MGVRGLKINIDKRLRQGLITSLLIAFGIISFLLYNQAFNRGFEEKKTILYKYQQGADINYNVFLKPNPLYENNSLGEGKVYITEFIKSINLALNYAYSAEKPADIKGNSEVIAVMEGFTDGDKDTKSIWKKTFSLVPKKDFKAQEKSFSIAEDVSLNLEDYNAIANKIIQDSKVGSQVRLSVFMNVNLKAETHKGVIEEKVSPMITIPLNTNFIEITKDQIVERPGAIEETEKIQIPVNKKIIAIYTLALIAFLSTLFWLKSYTIGTEKDQLTKSLNGIFKKHGDRLVALNGAIPSSLETFYKVKSIDDLVKIADEIAKPIFYNHSSYLKDITKFYVFDDNFAYILDLKEVLSETNVASYTEEEYLVKSWTRSQ